MSIKVQPYRGIALDDIEDGALDQVNTAMQLPFLQMLAIMPDIHRGYGVPIGSVLATSQGVVIPNAVGVDIGCGMAAVRLGYRASAIPREVLEQIADRVRQYVPVGFNKHSKPALRQAMPGSGFEHSYLIYQHMDNARISMGTLGGGNHFIEIQEDQDGELWAMVHSGSRNLGKQVCDHYNKVAKEVNKRYCSKVEADWDLAFFPRLHPGYAKYLEDMAYCVEFARLNRQHIMQNIIKAVVEIAGHEPMTDAVGDLYDICHNSARLENHLGKNVMVHRKGAAGPYSEGTVGIIPGSQGTSSYLVQYRNDADPRAMKTTSHGAGRAMGRMAAKRGLSLDDELKRLEGVVHQVRTKDDLDEAPGAYKDIDKVMEDQRDLCVITTKLTPLAVVKG
ncbi:MAG: RtcB family protein [Gammaproteobacteria bacterium]|nr:RtcB family protein [Gammaproteobacteria bacterium]